MAKKTSKAAPAASTAPAKKRSKLKLALLAAAPLALAGGGYGGWMFFAAPLQAQATEGPKLPPGIDPHRVEVQKAESASESTFTYALALSEFLKKECGALPVGALKAASEAEARADGELVNRSWMAAARRAETVTDVSCYRMQAEILKAEARAAAGPAVAEEAKAAH